MIKTRLDVLLDHWSQHKAVQVEATGARVHYRPRSSADPEPWLDVDAGERHSTSAVHIAATPGELRGPTHVDPATLATMAAALNEFNMTGDARWYPVELPLSSTSRTSGSLRRVELWLLTEKAAQVAGMDRP
jgi:hypothetical protein